MMTPITLAAGFIALIIGAEALVRGASKLAAALGIAPLVIGLTVVAYGTSAPEMAVSVMAGLAGQGDISLGNAVGSNIFNVLFILGLSALIAPLTVSQQLVRLDVPIMIAVSLAVMVLGADGVIGRLDGMLLLAGMIAYTAFLIAQSRRQFREGRGAVPGNRTRRPPGWGLVNLALIGGGLALLVLGSRWLVAGSVAVARWLGVGELIIGLTVVAAGTSLPEVAASVAATIRGERDIAVGNVVGSNIFNILAVLGLAGIVTPNGIPVAGAAWRFDIPVMIATAVACLPVFFTGHVIARWEGALFLGYYAVYTLYLIAAARHDALPLLSTAMLGFVIPLTALTLGIVSLRSLRRRSSRTPPTQ